ncbi:MULTISPECIES: hypothetical protein [Thalassomonas]|uniref:Uncharacterized protein n=1 Tax=Thalassomonas actiniarum TaxID=485447 RepID=A0AAF0C2X6_9GAMM|nr:MULTISPECIES: hypothetical protein [Thalassomonas]WDD98305.1 hypothetical protein SG35_024005 [Thalassomonas actiniarum]
MKKKIVLALAAMGMGVSLASFAYVSPGQWEQRYCAENPHECYCEYRSGRKYCFIL